MKQLLLNNKSNNFLTVPKIPKPQSMPKTLVYLGLGGNYNLENGGYSNANFYMHPTISHQFDKGWGLSVSPGTFVHNSVKYPGGHFRLTGFLPEQSVTVSKSFLGGGLFGNILNKAYKSNANFAERLRDPNRKFIPDWATDAIATHKMGVGTDENGLPYIFPLVLEINGELMDFTRPPYNRGAGMISAEERGDTIHVPTIKDGVEFTENYKKYFPNFQTGGTIPVGKVAKTAFKIFKGDHLKLMKQRLKNGGFERLAKTAKEHYVKDTGIDNNMTSMFESVEDSNKFSNWISRNAPLIPLELAMKSIVLRNQPDPLSAKKGSKIAKHSWSANFGHTVDGNPNLDNMKNDYVTKKKKKHA